MGELALGSPGRRRRPLTPSRVRASAPQTRPRQGNQQAGGPGGRRPRAPGIRHR